MLYYTRTQTHAHEHTYVYVRTSIMIHMMVKHRIVQNCVPYDTPIVPSCHESDTGLCILTERTSRDECALAKHRERQEDAASGLECTIPSQYIPSQCQIITPFV